MVRVRLYIYFEIVQRKILHTDSHDKIGYSTKLPDSRLNHINHVFPTSGICITIMMIYIFFDIMKLKLFEKSPISLGLMCHFSPSSLLPTQN